VRTLHGVALNASHMFMVRMIMDVSLVDQLLELMQEKQSLIIIHTSVQLVVTIKKQMKFSVK
jgi:hypothetical protein